HHGNKSPVSVATATAATAARDTSGANGRVTSPSVDESPISEAATSDTGEPLVIREKVHDSQPVTLDQALYEMELVGHDFYLFIDADNGRPSVVYRRRAYDYGVIRLGE